MSATIPAILTWPDQTPVDSVQLKITAAYPRKTNIGQYKTSVQNAEGQDVAGNKIRMVIWGHADIDPFKGKDVVLSSGPKGGVKVKHGSYENKAGQTVNTVELEVSKAGQFQYVEVHKAQSAASGAPSDPTPAHDPQPASNGLKTQGNPVSMPSVVNGAKVGMAINQAITIVLTHVGPTEDTFYKAVAHHASRIIELSHWLEAGNLVPKKTDKTPPHPEPAPAAPAPSGEEEPF